MNSPIESYSILRKIIAKEFPALDEFQFGSLVEVKDSLIKENQVMRYLGKIKIEEVDHFILLAPDMSVLRIAKKDFYEGVKRKRIFKIGQPVLLGHVVQMAISKGWVVSRDKINLTFELNSKNFVAVPWDFSSQELECQEPQTWQELKNLFNQKK